MQCWNYLASRQLPVYYTRTGTGNNHTFKRTEGENVVVLVVKQFKCVRNPKFPFRTRTIYQYEVSHFIFKNSAFVSKVVMDIPEYCNSLFRNTNIPHLLAVNAFLEVTGQKESFGDLK